MKIGIHFDHLPQSGQYTSLDVVTGSIHLVVQRGLSLSQLVVSLRGDIRFQPPSDGNAPVYPAFGPQPQLSQKLFATSQTLFPTHPLSTSSRYKLGKGRHEFCFGIDFPLLSRCFNIGKPQCHKAQDDLLRHMHPYHCKGASFRVVYTLQATVKRCGTFRWDRTASRRLPFVPLDQPNFKSTLQRQPSRDCQIIPCGNLRRDAEEADGAQLPSYTPAVFTEAGINSAKPLRPGDAVPLRLVITVPVDIAKELDLHLKSIHLALRKTTVLLVAGKCETRLSEIEIGVTKTNIRISPNPARDNTFEVDPCWWKDFTIPQITPELSSRIIEQDYWLQILGEFHSETTSMSTFVTLLLPVVIIADHSPPTYNP